MFLRKVKKSWMLTSGESDDEVDEGDEDRDSEHEELDVSQPRRFGSRKSTRTCAHATAFGYQLDSSAIALTEDSEQ